MQSMTRSRGGSNNCCHFDEVLLYDIQLMKCAKKTSVISVEDEVTSTVKFYCGLLTFIIEGNAEFELKVNKNKVVIYPHSIFGLPEFYLKIP